MATILPSVVIVLTTAFETLVAMSIMLSAWWSVDVAFVVGVVIPMAVAV
jgi:hypothetical protein